MAKSKTEQPEKPAHASPAVTNGQKSGQKKKKKNDPLRPQPAWLFPPDEENPVLNPKVKSEEQVQKETDERLAAINFLEHRSVTAPVKEAPPGLLLQLISAFLTSYGFNHTGRIFTTERDARKKIQGWNDEIGKKFDKNTPTLVSIFKRWQRDFELEQAEAKLARGDETSSEEDDSDVSSEEEEPAEPVKKDKKAGKVDKDSDSDSSSTEDDSEDDSGVAKASTAKPVIKVAAETSSKKRKSSSSDSDSDSGSDSSSDETGAPAKKQKVAKNAKGEKKVTTTQSVNGVKTKKTVKATPSKVEKTIVVKSAVDSSDNSDTEDDSDSDSSEEAPKSNGVAVATNGDRASTESSNTLNGDAKKAESSESDDSSDSSSSSEDDAVATKQVATPSTRQKRKRSKSPAATVTPVSAAKVAKKSNEPFSRIPKDQFVDPKLASNKYVPYDYAQKAHEDLVVTKGKGFTKEKNKKKRGSYRGGLIDVGGGKGIKFAD